jgi:hypothetical protein
MNAYSRRRIMRHGTWRDRLNSRTECTTQESHNKPFSAGRAGEETLNDQKKDGSSWSRNKPVSGNKDSDQTNSNNTQACSAKLVPNRIWCQRPTDRIRIPCREMSDLYCQVRRKHGRFLSQTGNWESYRTAEGDNTGWQGNHLMIVTLE